MIISSSKQKLYLVGSGFLIVFILIFTIIIFPLIEKIKLNNTTLEEQKMASENFYQNWKDLISSKKNYQQIQNEMADQATFLSKNEDLKFIIAIEKITQTTGNRQEIFLINAKDKTTENETALKLQISLYGDFRALLNFLVQMENTPYFNDINSLQINRITTKENSNDKTGEINSIINLSAYY